VSSVEKKKKHWRGSTQRQEETQGTQWQPEPSFGNTGGPGNKMMAKSYVSSVRESCADFSSLTKHSLALKTEILTWRKKGREKS
jgi:hypothetical protein